MHKNAMVIYYIAKVILKNPGIGMKKRKIQDYLIGVEHLSAQGKLKNESWIMQSNVLVIHWIYLNLS